eukprot:GILI01018070.1.p1 GENE.GILI01018070.1~~GILI01018070.1.p1  ORF type:complete len:235 (-),score=56.06 GILI01018070.1:168-836(-)
MASIPQTILYNLLTSVFGDPVIRDVDDDELPLPEHRINTEHIGISDEPEIKRIRAEGYLPELVRARDGTNGSTLNSNLVSKKIVVSASRSGSGAVVVTETTEIISAASPKGRASVGSKRTRSTSAITEAPITAAAAASPKAAAASTAASPKARVSASPNRKKTHAPHYKPGASDDEHDNDEPNETWTVAELRGYASTNKLDLGRVSLKADILDKILEAEAEE